MSQDHSNASAAGPASATGPALLRMRGMAKRYGGVHALRGADLTISGPGVVHTLVGENGSGKSTLLGILAGNVRPDGGEIEIAGSTVAFRTPVDAVKRGIAMVSQEIAVAPDLSIAENVLLGRRLAKGALGISPRATRARAKEILERLGLDYDPRAEVGSLRPDQRQMIEIARAVSMDAKILILDEPTSSLTDDEVDGLFRTIGELKAAGVSIIFVSHRLSDLFEIADEVTVLRDGVTVCEAPMSMMDTDALVGQMVGESEQLVERRAVRRSRIRDEVALKVRQLSAVGVLEEVSFEVHAGEIVGLAGLAGSGRSELLEALYGARSSIGEVEVDGERFDPVDPRASIRAGIGFVPPDRKTQGLNLAMSVRDNLTVINTLGRARTASPKAGPESVIAARAAEEMRVKTPSLEAAVGSLSGGNQQKVALGRWLTVDRKILLLDEPTRGVDVAAKWEIQERMRGLADRGMALLVSSSENDELRDLCDRILILFRGRIVASLASEQASEAELARLAGGHL